MRKPRLILLIALFAMPALFAQIKIGDNPQAISPTSVLELESSDRVLVITRISTSQMNAIVPNQGAMVYNTDTQCVHYYDGTQWINLCNSAGLVFTTDPIINNVSTIVITDQAGTKNFEVAPNSIGTEQIINGGINGIDIQDGSIGPGKLQDQSVTQDKLSENSVGAFALDNANIGLTDFTNDAGFITGADIVSGDAGNNISIGSDNGAFYDNQAVLDAIGANTASIQNHIVTDADTNPANELQSLQLTGNDLTITLGNTVTLPGGGNPTDELITNMVLNGSNELVITEGANPSVMVDLSSLAGAGGNPTDELTDISFNTTTNILSLTNPATVPGGSVDLSSLAGGGADGSETIINDSPTVTVAGTGTALDPYILASTGGADGSETIIDAATSTIGVTGTGTALDPYILTSAAVDVTFAPAGNTVSTDVQNAIEELQTDIDGLAAGGEPNTSSNQGAGGVGLTLPKNVFDLPFKSINSAPSGIISVTDDTGNNEVDLDIADNSITAIKLNDMGATADGEILQWDTTLNAGAGGWVVAAPTSGVINEQNIALDITDNEIDLVNNDATIASSVKLDGTTLEAINNGTDDVIQIADDAITLDKLAHATNEGDVMRWDATNTQWILEAAPGEHTGIANSVFFADDTTGAPTEDNDSFAWDPNARLGFGQLQIGLDGNIAPTDVSKVVIAETLSGSDVMYPLLIQTSAPAVSNASTGILFSPEVHAPATLAKGALIYQRTGAWATGDFHFLQNDQTANQTEGELKPTTTDKAFTVRNNKDIVIYGGVEIDGIGPGTGLGAVGEVLTSTGGGVQWAAAGGTTPPTDTGANDGLTDYSATTGYDVQVDNSTIQLFNDELRIPAGGVTGNEIEDFTIANTKIEPLTPTPATDNMLITDTSGAVVWSAVPSGLTPPVDADINDGLSVYNAATGYDVQVDDSSIEINADALQIRDQGVTLAKIVPESAAPANDKMLITDTSGNVVWDDVPTGTGNLATNNLIQTATEDRTYDMSGQTLSFFNGRIGIGTGTLDADPDVALHVLGNGQVRAASFKVANGSASLPGYRFTNDVNSGLFLPTGGNQLGLSSNGAEALRIDASQNVGIGTTTPAQRLHVVGNFQLDGGFIASNGAGAVNEVLTRTGAGTEWAPAGGLPSGGTAGQVLSTDGVATPTYSWVNNDDQDATEVNLNPAIDVDYDSNNETTVQEAIADLSANKIIGKGRVPALGGAAGAYTENVPAGLPTGAIIQLTVEENFSGNPIMIHLVGTTAASFSVQISEWDGFTFVGANSVWNYIIVNP